MSSGGLLDGLDCLDGNFNDFKCIFHHKEDENYHIVSVSKYFIKAAMTSSRVSDSVNPSMARLARLVFHGHISQNFLRRKSRKVNIPREVYVASGPCPDFPTHVQ